MMILAFHPPIHGKLVFSNSMVVRFLKGVICLHPPVDEPVPLWDLNTVIAALMGPPFEPLATSFSLLCQKIAFLVAIMSVRRVSELQALVVS